MHYPFEIHLTTRKLLPGQLPKFIAACQHLQAKPLLIELARGVSTTQPMLGKVLQLPSLEAALAAATHDGEYLQERGMAPVRLKIETAASYSHLANTGDGRTFLPYFEWHGKVAYHHTEALLQLCQTHRAHLSVNAIRNAGTTRFVTLREFGEIGIFERRVAALITALAPDWPLLKQESECCLYDSNSALDAGWLPQ